jgi:hypothetical protein
VATLQLLSQDATRFSVGTETTLPWFRKGFLGMLSLVIKLQVLMTNQKKPLVMQEVANWKMDENGSVT